MTLLATANANVPINVAQQVGFGIVAAAMVWGALRVVTTKNVVHAALYLVVVLAGAAAQYILLAADYPKLWWVLSTIISCGTAAGALIPEFTKFFTSTKSRHVDEIVKSASPGTSRRSGPVRSSSA